MTQGSEQTDCRRLRRVLGRVLEGEPEPEALAHLDACARCRLLVEDLSAIARAATELPAYDPNPSLWPRLLSAAAEEGLLRSTWTELLGHRLGAFAPLTPTPAFSAAAVVLLVVAVLLVGYPGVEVGPAREQLPTRAEVARSELVLAASYGERYALHLDRIEATLREEVMPADAELTFVAQTNLDTLDHCIKRCQLRLASYPEDEFTRAELNRLYQQKTTLLQAMLDPDWQTSLR